MSETATCRERLAAYCVGNGLDLGFGGDPIVRSAICIDRAETDSARSHHERPSPTHIVGDIWHLRWFVDGSLDYVYSSHALEDAKDTRAVLKEWLRVIRPGGYLVLFLPDQKTYEAHCRQHGNAPNAAHIHADFSLAFVCAHLLTLGVKQKDIVHSQFPVPNNAYSFDLVVQKR